MRPDYEIGYQMTRWKKILIAAALMIFVLFVALYAFLSLYDFNKFKPMIAKAVKDATGRELTIAGNIEFELGIRPTLVVETVSFQNASWSSTPNLAQVKRLEVQIAVLPIISGKFDIAHLVLVEPDLIVEFDSAGTSNLTFDTAAGEEQDTEISPPPLIFSDVLIEKGHFTYQDAQSDFKVIVRIDRLTAEIPGLDKSLQVDFEGAFDDIPFTLNGSVGPIWAWVAPGYSLPANLTAKAAAAAVKINGEIRDPANFKDLSFTIAAEGASTTAIAKLAGVTDMPELGAFNLAATVADPEGQLGIEGLDINVGSEELVAISITGAVKNALALQGIKLELGARGQDMANLTRLGLPPPPRKGPFKVTADISDPATKVFSVGNLNIVLGENEITGQVNLNLAEQVPFLTAELSSQKFELGPASLDLHLTGPLEKPAIKKLDLKLGTPELAEIHLNGVVEDLIQLQGVDINFQASGKDLANLKQLTGQPLPVRGAFSAAGEVLVPVHQNLKIPDLKITVGKNNISGLLNLDLRGDKPQLSANLSLPKLELPSVLLPELAKEGWAKGLG
ncbi:MAG: AsmA family protein, partial [Deltaproteobacteria bacterium]|nr:AsmA family protein [Deltaproteobacteria bacterium]